jgi:hypothetical protein
LTSKISLEHQATLPFGRLHCLFLVRATYTNCINGIFSFLSGGFRTALIVKERNYKASAHFRRHHEPEHPFLDELAKGRKMEKILRGS